MPDRCASPSSNKYTTSNSHQMRDKKANTVKLPYKQRSTWFLFAIYMSIVPVGTGQHLLLLNIFIIIEMNRRAPKPLHSHSSSIRTYMVHRDIGTDSPTCISVLILPVKVPSRCISIMSGLYSPMTSDA